MGIARRTKGGLTGTRTAGILGRVPILDMIANREPTWRIMGFKLESGPHAPSLTMATYIDNLYSVANSVDDAIQNIKQCGMFIVLHSMEFTRNKVMNELIIFPQHTPR